MCTNNVIEFRDLDKLLIISLQRKVQQRNNEKSYEFIQKI